MGFQAAAAAAAAKGAIHRDARVTNLARGTIATRKKFAPLDDAAADAFQQRDKQYVLRTAPGAVRDFA